MRLTRVRREAETQTRTACGTSFSSEVAPQPRRITGSPESAIDRISSAVSTRRLSWSVVRRSSSPCVPSRKLTTWLLRMRARLARWSMISWWRIFMPSACSRPAATSLPSEPISRFMAISGMATS